MTRGAQHRLPSERDHHDGFALIEIMFALLLIAVLAALAMPGLARPTGPAALRVAAFQVSALLRDDRNSAQGAGSPVVTRIDVNARRIAAGATAAVVTLPVGATLRLVDAASPSIHFSADGRSSGGTLLLETATARYIVVVRRDTGAIRVDAP